jgi:Restriction endonuclease
MSRAHQNFYAPGQRLGLQPYPPKPINRTLPLIFLWLAVIIGLGIPAVILFANWFSFNARTISTYEAVLLLTTGSLILIAVVGFLIVSLIATNRRYQNQLTRWHHQITIIRKDKIRAWQADMADWHKAIQKTATPHHPLASHLSNTGLEHFAADLFTKVGYETRVVGGAGDKGIDVHMRNPLGEVEIVQCKQWTKPVGSPEVIHFIGAMQKAQAVYGYIVAPNGFTRPAIEDAIGYNIILADESALQKLMDIAERYPSTLPAPTNSPSQPTNWLKDK